LKNPFWNLILLCNQGLTSEIPKFQVLHEGDKAKLEKSREHETCPASAKNDCNQPPSPKNNWNFGIFLYFIEYYYYYYYINQ
jgi:hypothetical protein